VSILKDEEKDLTIKVLNSSSKFVRSELGRRLRMKVIPEIEFRLDTTPQYGEKIERLLKEIREGS
jgi:ribosome-binding factor A